MAQGGELVGAREGVMGARVVGGDREQAMADDQRKEAEPEMPGAPRVWVGPVGNPGNPGLTSSRQGLPLVSGPQRGQGRTRSDWVAERGLY